MNRANIIGTSLFLLIFSLSVQAQTATINGNAVYQTISGWGASTGFAERNNNLSSAEADCFFSTSNGSCPTGNSIGLAWIRIQDNQTPNSAPDLPTLQLAVARGAKVFLSFDPQTAINSLSYSTNASYDVAKIQYFQSNGVTISAVSPINEPVNTGTTAVDIDTFVASYLWPAMNTAGLGSIPINVAESANWFLTDYVTPCMNDSSCKSHVTAVSGHGYYYGGQAGSLGVDGFVNLGTDVNCCVQYSVNLPPSSTAGLPIWLTEINGGATGPCAVDSGLANYDPSTTDASVWAHNIHDFLTVQRGTAWMYWNLASETANGPTPCNDGLTDQIYNPAKRFYAIGNWSRFVRPGWVRIAATVNPQTNVFVTAFKDPSSGSFAIVAINSSGGSTSQTFNLTGLTASAVTPWTTSSSMNLASQSSVSISGNAFTYSLPSTSVTTFVGGSNSGPAPPTHVDATVVE